MRIYTFLLAVILTFAALFLQACGGEGSAGGSSGSDDISGNDTPDPPKSVPAASFGYPSTYPVQGQPSLLTFLDANGDGYTDVVTTTSEENGTGDKRVVLLTGNGDGTLNTPRTVISSTYFPKIAATDFDLDGNDDLLVALGAESIVFLKGDGNGGFDQANTYPIDKHIFALTTHDLNLDGIPDIVGAMQPQGLRVIITDVNAEVTKTQTLQTDFQPLALAVDDFTGDHIPDIVTISNITFAVELYVGQGNGSFSKPVVTDDVATDSSGRYDLAACDFNEDGFGDIAVMASSSRISILFGSGNGEFSKKGIRTADMPTGGVACGDFNSDGHADVAYSLRASSRVVLLLGTGTGDFQGTDSKQGYETFFIDNRVTYLGIADLQRDGANDVVITSQRGQSVNIILNTANSDQ